MVSYGWGMEKYCPPTDPECMIWIRETIDYCRTLISKPNPPNFWEIWRARLLGYFAGNQNTGLVKTELMSRSGCFSFFSDLVMYYEIPDPREYLLLALIFMVGVAIVAALTISIIWWKRRLADTTLETTGINEAAICKQPLKTTIEVRLLAQLGPNQQFFTGVGSGQASAASDSENLAVRFHVFGNPNCEEENDYNSNVDGQCQSDDRVDYVSQSCPKCPNNSPTTSPHCDEEIY